MGVHLDDDLLARHAQRLTSAEESAEVREHIELCDESGGSCRSCFRSVIATPVAPAAAAAGEELLLRGTQVGRYLVIDLLGAGAMGTVYAAYDPELDRKVALKLLARLVHPNVVAIQDVGTTGDRVGHDGEA
jgi:serine/threonine protein kinase